MHGKVQVFLRTLQQKGFPHSTEELSSAGFNVSVLNTGIWSDNSAT